MREVDVPPLRAHPEIAFERNTNLVRKGYRPLTTTLTHDADRNRLLRNNGGLDALQRRPVRFFLIDEPEAELLWTMVTDELGRHPGQRMSAGEPAKTLHRSSAAIANA
ncbi:MAG: hypothetical protein ACQSGP_04980 [Frankia sp.]